MAANEVSFLNVGLRTAFRAIIPSLCFPTRVLAVYRHLSTDALST